jgi:hypothetical protein
MVTPAYYRAEARRCRELAAASPEAAPARRWRAIAADYDQLADFLDARPPFQGAQMQHQPMQQQQL